MSTNLNLQWLPPKNSYRNGIIRSYSVLLTSTNTGISTSYNTSGNLTSLHIPSLHPAYSFVIMVAAVTIHLGPYSDLLHVTMEEDSKWCVYMLSIRFLAILSFSLYVFFVSL